MNSIDEIIELYKRDVDVTLLEETQKMTVEERLLRAANAATASQHLASALSHGGVDFVIIGDSAAVLHGCEPQWPVFEILYCRSEDNLLRMEQAFAPLDAAPRGAPPGLPFQVDAPTLLAGLNLKLTTKLGWIDLLGEVAGGGCYEKLLPHSELRDVFGIHCRVVDLDTLIHIKRAAGRPRDFEAIAELELLRSRQKT